VESLYVDLIYDANDSNYTHACIDAHHTPRRFPTDVSPPKPIWDKLDGLLASWTQLSEANRKPLRELIEKLKISATHLNMLMAKPSFQSLTDELNSTMGGLKGLMGESGGIEKALDELQKTLKTTKRVMRGYGSGSFFGKKLNAMLKEIGQTSEETKRLIEKLNKKPNALIFGE